MWQTIISHCWKSLLLLLFTRRNISATVFESASVWPGGFATKEQAAGSTSSVGSAASAGPCGRSHALHGHAVNQAPEGEQVNLATCDLRTRVITNHAPQEA